MSAEDEIIDMGQTYVDAQGCFLFGKHRGQYLDDVAREDRGYLEWMIDELDLPDVVSDMIEAAMAGELRDVADRFRRVVRDVAPTLPPTRKVEQAPQWFAPQKQAAPDPLADRFGGLDLSDLVETPARSVLRPATAEFDEQFIRTARPARPPIERAPARREEPPLAVTLEGTAALPCLTCDHPVHFGSDCAVGRCRCNAVEKLPEITPLRAAPPPAPLPARALEIPEMAWNLDQQNALAQLSEWGRGPAGRGRMLSLTGYAGTGKTTLLRAALRFLPGVCLTAMTGKAALRLQQVTGCTASTLHAVLYMPPDEQQGSLEFAARRAPTMSTLIVDEASMVTPQIYMDLQEWAAVGVRILFVGDPFQLPPVISKAEMETWGADFSVFGQVKGPTLTRVMRSSGPILDAATHLREKRRVPTESNHPYRFERTRMPIAQAVSDYCLDPEDHILVTWRNELRIAANLSIRARLGHTSKLPERGEPVLIRQNTVGYMNGEITTVDAWREGPTIGGDNGKPGTSTMWLRTGDGIEILTLPQGHTSFFDGGRPFIEDWYAWRNYCREPDERPRDANGNPAPIPIPVTYGYCLTAHAMQGSECRRVTVFLGPGDGESKFFRKDTQLPNGETAMFSLRFLYTALSRAREEATLYVCGSGPATPGNRRSGSGQR